MVKDQADIYVGDSSDTLHIIIEFIMSFIYFDSKVSNTSNLLTKVTEDVSWLQVS